MNNEIQQQNIDGMVARGNLLRADEAIFLKTQGINEVIVKTETTREKNQETLADEKEILKGLQADKVKAVSGITAQIVGKMNEILPENNGYFNCIGGFKIGLTDEKGVIPFNGLSGYQLEIFKSAMANVLSSNLIIVEAAEIDTDRLGALLEDLAKSEKQVIINTCHELPLVPDEFEVVKL